MDRLQAMAVFVRVVESGSFSAAARRLHIGQPAASKAVAQIEQRLGVQLLLRTARGLTPTDAGQRYYEQVARVVADAEEADAAARGNAGGLEGLLRVALPTTLGSIQIVPRLGDFLAEHPKLEIDIELDDRRVDLVSEGIDVAIRVGPMHDSALIARRLAQGRRSVLATPGYLAQAPRLEAPEDLPAHRFLYYTRGSLLKPVFRRGDVETAVSLQARLRLSAAEGLRAALLADLGLTILTDWVFRPELERGAVRRCLTEWSLPLVDLWAVYPSGRMTSARARAFSDFVARVVGSPPHEGLPGLP